MVPTFNEQSNIPILGRKIALADINWEVIIVDDNSPDGADSSRFAMLAPWPNGTKFHSWPRGSSVADWVCLS
jgi:dolichol-phosphate mannosyltransferase